MDMKKKRVKISIGIIILICVLVCAGILCYIKNLSQILFGIDENDYQIVYKKNELKWNNYDGEYILKLRIEEQQLKDFD